MPSSAASARRFCSTLVEIGLGALLSASAISSSKPWIAASSSSLGVGHVLDRGEALGDQELGDHLLDVERVDEHLGQLAELALPALAILGLGDDVDVPAGELRGQAHVLAAPADRDVLHAGRGR